MGSQVPLGHTEVDLLTTDHWPSSSTSHYWLAECVCVCLSVGLNYTRVFASRNKHSSTHRGLNTVWSLTWQVHSVQSSTFHSSLFLCMMPLWMQTPLWMPMWFFISLFSSVCEGSKTQTGVLSVDCLFLIDRFSGKKCLVFCITRSCFFFTCVYKDQQ